MPAVASMQAPESFWRSLYHLNRFRAFLAFCFVLVPLYGEVPLISLGHPRLFVGIGLGYGAMAWLFGRALARRRPAFERQLRLQVITDIVFLISLIRLSGGNGSGIGLLLIVPMAAAGMHRDMRVTLFMTAMASLAVLTEQVAHAIWWQGETAGFMRAGLLAMGYFGVSAYSHYLASGAITAAELAGEKAAQAENLAQINARIIQELTDGVLVVDRDGRVIQHNARAEELLGCRVFGNAGMGHCAPALIGLWEAWRSTGASPETPFESGREGHRLEVHFIELEPTRKAGAVLLLRDMTEIEQEAQNMKLAALGRLTANLAHEIRNPLSSIYQAASLLEEESASQTMTRLTRIVQDNTQRLNDLVEDVLTLNRRDSQMFREPISMADFLRDFIAQFQHGEKVPDGVITLTVPEQLRVMFDRLHLHQVLWNLVRNAWRHCTKSRGSIQLRAIASEGLAHIEVFNDGQPISPEMQKRLFEPFYTTDRQGTGLGLHIARELTDANGGTLRYVDQAGGALFRISCAVANEEA
jgi:two-component system sensor histidine kinase PilS (NtrC family)